MLKDVYNNIYIITWKSKNFKNVIVNKLEKNLLKTGKLPQYFHQEFCTSSCMSIDLWVKQSSHVLLLFLTFENMQEHTGTVFRKKVWRWITVPVILGSYNIHKLKLYCESLFSTLMKMRSGNIFLLLSPLHSQLLDCSKFNRV